MGANAARAADDLTARRALGARGQVQWPSRVIGISQFLLKSTPVPQVAEKIWKIVP